MINWTSIIIKITLFIFSMVLVLTIAGIISLEFERIITDCSVSGERKFRTVGTGGLFGGTRLVQVHEDSNYYDTIKDVCLAGYNYKGDWIVKEVMEGEKAK